MLAKKLSDLQSPNSDSVTLNRSFFADRGGQRVVRDTEQYTHDHPTSNPAPQTNRIQLNQASDSIQHCGLWHQGVRQWHLQAQSSSREVSSTITTVDPSIPESSIRDCTGLGKYSSEICRPLLVKLSRTCEVLAVRSQTIKLKDIGLSIKADVPQQRMQERRPTPHEAQMGSYSVWSQQKRH